MLSRIRLIKGITENKTRLSCQPCEIVTCTLGTSSNDLMKVSSSTAPEPEDTEIKTQKLYYS